MGTLFDYVNWRGDLSFSEAPFNDVDNLIFSLLSYLDFSGIVPGDHSGAAIPIKAAANSFLSKNPDLRKFSMGLIVPKEIILLCRAVKDTRRFANVEMRAFVNTIDTEREMQFSAITFFPGDGSMLVTYRGTDDTIVGWKENFNMSYLPVVPAQLEAASYLNRAAKAFPNCPIYVNGHSKGGNLAVYAAVHCAKEVRPRIQRVWNNDGPGFKKDLLSSPEYLQMRPNIQTLLPESSVVGMLLKHEENYTVVKSKQTGLLQHNGLNWEVMGNSFIHLKTVTQESRQLDRDLNEWISMMTPEQCEQFTDSLYKILSSDNALTLSDLASANNKWLKRSQNLDPLVHKTIRKTLSCLMNVSLKNRLGGVLSPKNGEGVTPSKPTEKNP